MDKHYTYRWFAIAVLFLGVGGAFALSIGLSRTPFGYRYLPADFLFQAIVGHVILAIVFWLLSFTVVLWSIYFKGRQWRLSYILPLLGALCVTFAVFTEGSKAVANNYIPTIDHPVFFLGLVLFFTGFMFNALAYLRDSVRVLSPGKKGGEGDIVRSTLAISVPVGVVMVMALVVSLILFAVGSSAERGLIFFERLFWIPGHIQQVLNGVLLVGVWYALKGAIGLPCRGFRFMGFFNMMFLVSAIVLFAIPFLIDPIAKDAKVISEIVYAVGLGVPIFAHGVNILRGLKRNGNNVQFISLILSMAIYFFGIAIAYSGFGNDLRVPAHYHGAVTGLTLAMMGLSHHYLGGARIKGFIKRLGEIQPAVYGVGMILVISGLMVSGIFGAPRKTYGVSFATEPVVLLALTVMGIGTLLAVAGGVLFVFYSSVTLLKGGGENVRY